MAGTSPGTSPAMTERAEIRPDGPAAVRRRASVDLVYYLRGSRAKLDLPEVVCFRGRLQRGAVVQLRHEK
jgi:hypothetical protein